MSVLHPPGTTPEEPGRDTGGAVDAIGQSAPINGATVAAPGISGPTRSAAPNIRLRLLEAELRAERRHATTTEERLKQVQASLQHALEQIEERRVTVVELQTVLQATEPRLIALERMLAERDQQLAAQLLERQPAGATDPVATIETRTDAAVALAPLREQLRARDAACQALEHALATTRAAHAAELERLRAEQFALAARLAAAKAGGLSDTEQRLHTTELTLEHTLRELAEARVAPVELRAALAVAEQRATTLQAQLTAAKRTAEMARAARASIDRPSDTAGHGHAAGATNGANRTVAADPTVQSIQAQLEEQQIICIELQTVLEATERRLASVQATLAERERELITLRVAASTADAAPAGDSAQPPQPQVAELETQLRSLGTTLAQTLGELEEQRAAAAGLEAMQGFGEQRLATLEETLRRRDQEIATLKANSQSERARAQAELVAAAARLDRLARDSEAVLDQLSDELPAARAHNTRLEDQMAALSAALTGAEAREAAGARDLTEWSARHAALQAQLGAAETRHRHLAHDFVTVRDQQAQSVAENRHLAAEVARVRQESVDLAGRLLSARNEGAAEAQRARDLEADVGAMHATVADLRQRLAERDTDTRAVRQEADAAAVTLRDLREQRVALERELQTATATTHQLEHTLIGAESEREALRAQVATLESASVAFQDERQQLRRSAAVLREELTGLQRAHDGLQAQLADLERASAEAAERHAADLHRERATTQQQEGLLREASSEREALSQQVAIVRAAHAATAAELDSQRGEQAQLAARLRELEAPAAAPHPPPSVSPTPAPQAAVVVEIDAATPGVTGPLTIVHIEDQPSGRDAVRAAANRQPGTRYVCPQFPPAGAIRGATLLAVNLLCRHLDPLAVIADAKKWGVPEPRAFTYCSDGTRNMVLGLIEYFPFPFDPEACAARLFERPEGARRLLAVSNHIELMTVLRGILSNGRCSTTVALDGRQALDLVKPVNPDTILIDLALPRGEALDVVNRLSTDPATGGIPVAFLWTQKLGSGIFRQYASRVLQDWHGDSTAVGPALVKLLGAPQPAREVLLRQAG